MKCFWLSLLIAGVCAQQSNVPQERENILDKLRGYVFGSAGENVGGETTNVIVPYLPIFLDPVEVGSVSDKLADHPIQFTDVKIHGLSTTHAVNYRINLYLKTVQIKLAIRGIQIKGLYSISESSSSVNTTSGNFEYNFYDHVTYFQNTSYDLPNGRAVLGKTSFSLKYNRVRLEYSNLSDAFPNLKNFVSQNVMNTVSSKIYGEYSGKLYDNLIENIEKENFYKAREVAAVRMLRAINDSFEVIHLCKSERESSSVFLADQTNFHRIIHNFDVLLPTFSLRNVDGYHFVSSQPSYSENGVHLKVFYELPSPTIIVDVYFKDKDDAKDMYRVVQAQYTASDMLYEFDLTEKLGDIVRLDKATVVVEDVTKAPTQGYFGSEIDFIIKHLPTYLKSYLTDNFEASVSAYVSGFLNESLNAEIRKYQSAQ